MGLELKSNVACRPDSGGTLPFYFSSGPRRLFAWLHLPAPQARTGMGLVICAPFGYEAICAHRSLRSFAEQASELGIPAIRFDYAGTGDSEDLAPEADQLEAWANDILAAAEELRRRSGVTRIALLGIRLGALLAALASRTSQVDALIMIAPVLTGRRYLSEIRTTQLAASMARDAEADEERPPEAPAKKSAAGQIEVSGFSMSAATTAALAACDLTRSEEALSPRRLIIDNERLPTSRVWAESQISQGQSVKYLALPGVVEMIMTAPQFASVPAAIVKASLKWLLEACAASNANAEPPTTLAEDGDQILALGLGSEAAEASGPTPTLTERPIAFGSDGALFGILTEPHPRAQQRRAVVMVNAGADFHIGANRMYVELARDWARHGFVVLRFDLAGIGDSATRANRPTDEVFPPQAMDDIGAAITLIQTRFQIEDITIGGLCSGAYHALRAGTLALPVKRLLLINPQNYFWKEGMTVLDMQLVEVVSGPGVYGNLLRSTATWKRLLTLRINHGYVLRIIGRRLLLSMESRLRNLARHLRIPISNDLGRELEDVDARGTRVVMVFARGEAGLDLLKIQAGSSLTRLRKGFALHIVDDADHVFSRTSSRRALNRILHDELLT
jgi:alpha-beta hydrolase superfamily lysophospholipase